MSTSILYHGFGLRGHRYVKAEYVEGTIRFHIELKPRHLKCPECGTHGVIRRGYNEREFKGLPVGSTPVRIVLPIPRVECRRCGIVRQVQVPFADRRRSYTRSFERYVLELCGLTTIQDVAHHLGVSWGLVKGIHMRYLRRRFSKPRLKGLKHIAIDEISIQKGHHYLTVVLDLGTGAVVFVGHSRGADSLEEFWPRLRRSGACLEAVATDMLPAYISAVLEQVPEAALVFDRFHVVRLYNEKLTLLRRKLQREADEMEKEVLKGTRWLLLKHEEKLDEKKDERRRLEAALELNKPLATAYYMKDDLWQFWEQPDKESARMHLEDWIERARASGIGILKKFAATLESHAYGLLSWYDHPISTGPLEGTNNKIKTLQRQAYGYRDQQYFRLRIYGMHEQKYALIG